MPGSSKAVDYYGNEIIFEEDGHKYWSPNHEDVKYVSATTFVHSFAKPFDSMGMAEKVAKKRGITAAEVIKEWDFVRDSACKFGTRVHETCEDVLKSATSFRNQPRDEKELRVMEQGKAMASKILKTYEIVAVEQILFDITLGISGTADLIVKSPKTNSLVILDWKTNASIDKTNKYGDTMLKCVAHLSDCNFNHYSLQLSLYEYILKKRRFFSNYSYDGIQRAIIHLTEDNAEIMLTPDYGKEIRDMVICKLSHEI